MNDWLTPRGYAPDLYVQLHRSWAMPSARAGRPTARAMLRCLGYSATIAIAAYRLRRLVIHYFGMPLGQLTVCLVMAAFMGFAIGVQF